MGIGSNVKRIRTKLGMDQKTLASKLGVTAGAVSNYENDVSAPKEEVLFRMFEVLNVTPDELFEGCYAETKKAPASEDAGEEEKVQMVVQGLTRLLVEAGWIAPGADLSDAQLRTLASYVIGLSAYFNSDL